MERRIYLDYAATTPVDPQVREAMLPFLDASNGLFGNPSSVHSYGQEARAALDSARDTLADELGCMASEIVFTSGGTEADNLALIGVLLACRDRGNHLVTTAVEHHAVLDCAEFAARELGFDVTVLPVDEYGRVSPDAVEAAITDRTVLVSVMHANNEIGTIQPIKEIARRVRARRVYMHTDAIQTFGQIPFSVSDLDVDLLSLSAHKIYGPKGVGALYVRRRTPVARWLHGGQQEREKRAGTENVAGIAGFGKAVALLPERRWSEEKRVRALRGALLSGILARIPDARLNGHPEERLPNNLNLSFPGTDFESLLLGLDMRGVAASAGSACASGSIEPSHVLLALGMPLGMAKAAVRFSLGRGTTEADIREAVERIAACVEELRGSHPTGG